MDKVYLYTFYIFRFFKRYTPKLILNSFLNFLAWLAYKVSFKNQHFVKESIVNNKRIIAITSHYENRELLRLSFAVLIHPIVVVGRDIVNEILKENKKQLDMAVMIKLG